MTTTLISGVRVVERDRTIPDQAVLISDGAITAVGGADEVNAPDGCNVADGTGMTLLAGFIEAHAHPDGVGALEAYARAGVTTVIDMGSRDRALYDAAALRADLPTLLSPGLPATAPRGMQTATMGFPTASEVVDAADAARFVREQVDAGADFIKVIVEDPKIPRTRALPPEVLSALVARAHEADRIVVAHTVTVNALALADDAGVDVITHVPVDGVPDDARLDRVASRGVVLIPTLTMMDAAAQELSSRLLLKVLSTLRIAPALRYSNSEQVVRGLQTRGARILVGTDANTEPKVPARPAFALTFAEEVERLAAVGMAPLEVLWAATGATAEVFGLDDRGSVEAGKRADLVLVEGDPSADLSCIRKVRSVWINGRVVAP